MQNMQPMNFWVQKVLPLVFDDSLSYLEVVSKVVAKLNDVINNENAQNEFIEQINQNEQNFELNMNQKYQEFSSQLIIDFNFFKDNINSDFDSFKDNINSDFNSFKDNINSDLEDYYNQMMNILDNFAEYSNIVLYNKIVNSSFENNTVGWVFTGNGIKEIDNVVFKFGNHSAKFEAINQQAYCYQDVTFPDNHLIYVSAYIYITSGDLTLRLQTSNYNTSDQNVKYVSFNRIFNQWQRASLITTANNGGVRVFCGTGATSTFSYNIDGFVAIDLTADYGVTSIEDFEKFLVKFCPDFWFENEIKEKISILSLLDDIKEIQIIINNDAINVYNNTQISLNARNDILQTKNKVDILPEFKNIILHNKILNNNFEDDIINWITVGLGQKIIDDSLFKFGTKSVKLIANAQQSYIYQQIPFPDNHLIYVSAYIYITSGDLTLRLQTSNYNTSDQNVKYVSFNRIFNQWQRASLITTANNGGVRVFCGTGATSTFSYNIDGFVAIDLTADYGVTSIEDFEISFAKICPEFWFYEDSPPIPLDDKKLISSIDGVVQLVNLEQIFTQKYISPLKNKIIVNFGDSIFGNSRPPNDISTYLSDATGAVVHNVAFGGCRMSTHTGHWDAFSMYRLAYSIVNKDYSIQDDALSYSDRPSYAEEPLTLLKTIDFDAVDYITIAYGTNDWSTGKYIDNVLDAHDITTFLGATRYSLDLIMNKFKKSKIILISPTWRCWIENPHIFIEDSDTKLNTKNVLLSEFCSELKKTSKEYHCNFIDNYNININKFNFQNFFPINDGTHHNEYGRQRITEYIIKNI